MKFEPLTNSEIAARQAETERRYGTVSVGTGVADVSQAYYTFGRYQVRWWGNQAAEVRDAANGSQLVHTGTRDDCIAWAKARQ